MSKDRIRVLIEFEAVPGNGAPSAGALERQFNVDGLSVDPGYEPVPMEAEGAVSALVVRGELPRERVPELERAPGVLRVWSDAPIEPFHHGFGA